MPATLSTEIDEYPWTVLIEHTRLFFFKAHHCGGSLINNRYVLTAAHCVSRQTLPPNWIVSGVRLGEWDRSTAPDCQICETEPKYCADLHLDVGIDEIIEHPNFDGFHKNWHDIALVRLSHVINFTHFISPVCLPITEGLRTKKFEDAEMDVIGWGLSENFKGGDLKLKATVEGWKFETCRQLYQDYTFANIQLDDTILCARGKNGSEACLGDSGGPLVSKEEIDDRKVYVLAGIISLGTRKCGDSDWPGLYTRVGAYVNWIVRTIRP